MSLCANRITLFLLIINIFILQNVYANERVPEPDTGIESKSVIQSDRFIAVTANKYATQSAYDVLEAGGSAIDAAIAAQMVLNVVEPQSSGIGGGGFLLYYDKENNRLHNFDGRETAPVIAKTTMFMDEKGNPRKFKDVLGSGLSVGTPGLLHMLHHAHAKFGVLEWDILFKPAIRIAEEGFPLSPRLHKVLGFAQHLKHHHRAAKMYLTDEMQPKSIGTILKNTDFSRILKDIASEGIEPFYNGYIAKNIVEAVRYNKRGEGYLSEYDFHNYRTKERMELCGLYRGYKVCGMAPSGSGGIALLQVLGILEHFDVAALKEDKLKAIHLISEATRIAFADRNYYVADSDFVSVPINNLISPDYAKLRSQEIDLNHAKEIYYPGEFYTGFASMQQDYEPQSTTHMSIVDSYGNVVSMTTTIEHAFGAGIMVNGFMLNNQLTDFSFRPDIDGRAIANRLEAGKRPRSSMAPVIIFDKKNKPVLVLGAPGGTRIIPYVIKTVISIIDWEMSPQEAVSSPHFVTVGKTVDLEQDTAIVRYKEQLEAMGHNVRVRSLNSGLHVIGIQNGVMQSGVDPRREGTALGK